MVIAHFAMIMFAHLMCNILITTCNVGDLGSIPRLGRSPSEGMATHSSILAWRIPWTVSSMGSQRAGHN